MAKQVKSVWSKLDIEQEPDIYKLIKNEDMDALIKDFDTIKDELDYELGYDDGY